MVDLKDAKGILFCDEMIRAFLADNKTHTRRVLKPHSPSKAKKMGYEYGCGLWFDGTHVKDYSVNACWIDKENYIKKYIPHKVGDILYAKETYGICADKYHRRVYRADDEWKFGTFPQGRPRETLEGGKWQSAMFMPKSAARIFLRIKDVDIQNLNDITEEDALKEGVVVDEKRRAQNLPCYIVRDMQIPTAKGAFITLWNLINEDRDGGRYTWFKNPAVVRYELERIGD